MIQIGGYLVKRFSNQHIDVHMLLHLINYQYIAYLTAPCLFIDVILLLWVIIGPYNNLISAIFNLDLPGWFRVPEAFPDISQIIIYFIRLTL